MGVHHRDDFADVAIVLHDHRQLMDEVGSMGSEEVCAEYAPTGIGEDFCKAIFCCHSQCLAVGTVEGFVCHVCHAFFRKLLLGLTSRR